MLLKKDDLLLTRITADGTTNPNHHRYNIQTLRGIYCVTHAEGKSLYEQLHKHFKEKENGKKMTSKS